MKYYIDYKQITGEILGYLTDATVSQKQGDVLEVDFFKYNEAMAFNKIIIDGKNITFEKVDWRTPDEIAQQELEIKKTEALRYLGDTDFYYPRYLETGEPVPTDVVIKRQEYRTFLRENENVR